LIREPKTRFRLHSTRLKVDSLSLSLSQKHNHLTEIVLERAAESRIRVSLVWFSHPNHCTLHKLGCSLWAWHSTKLKADSPSLSLTKSWIRVSRVWCSPEPLHFAQVGRCSLCEVLLLLSHLFLLAHFLTSLNFARSSGFFPSRYTSSTTLLLLWFSFFPSFLVARSSSRHQWWSLSFERTLRFTVIGRHSWVFLRIETH
jgi:hypothetical protein